MPSLFFVGLKHNPALTGSLRATIWPRVGGRSGSAPTPASKRRVHTEIRFKVTAEDQTLDQFRRWKKHSWQVAKIERFYE